MDGEQLKRAFGELFRDEVINHGDYSLVYGQAPSSGAALLIGYRRTPLELMFCPVEVCPPSPARGAMTEGMVRRAGPITSVSLTDVATVADTGRWYRVESVTGRRIVFEVPETLHFPAASSGGYPGDGAVVLVQGQDAEDFHQFMSDFMDTLDGFYAVPDVIEFPGPTLLASA
ncbi:MAG: hypothetical protein QJR09_13065 [Micrococcus sp.]|nr:hypothetical protein [Micrococcus sp.]